MEYVSTPVLLAISLSAVVVAHALLRVLRARSPSPLVRLARLVTSSTNKAVLRHVLLISLSR